MSDFVEVASVDELPPGRSTCVTVAGKRVALFNVEGAIHAMADACLHQGQSLAAGRLNGKIVTCRAHGWRYNVCTGKTLNVPDYGVVTYPSKVEDGKILVDITQEKAAP